MSTEKERTNAELLKKHPACDWCGADFAIASNRSGVKRIRLTGSQRPAKVGVACAACYSRGQDALTLAWREEWKKEDDAKGAQVE